MTPEEIHAMTDKVYVMHNRLVLFLGEAWAAQVIDALRIQAQTSAYSYLELLNASVSIAGELYAKGKV